jgi:hypothetical protein
MEYATPCGAMNRREEGRMGQTVRFQDILGRLALIDAGFVKDQRT